jgi:hypothetical protein
MTVHKLLLTTASQMRLQEDIGITREDTSQHFTPSSHSDLIVAALLLFPFLNYDLHHAASYVLRFFSFASQISQMEGGSLESDLSCIVLRTAN